MNELISKVQNNIYCEKLLNRDDKILMAISGGCDSVALTHILIKLGYNISLAHCNFNLRDKDSDNDEIFVREMANTYHVKLFVKSFDTLSYSNEKKISIEESARILRYQWFEFVIIENSLNKIVTAHHLDDHIETVFINITAGTGIRGLTGIPTKNNHIVRPMLNVSRDEVISYCKENDLLYRTDQTNFETKYIRNSIRHKVIPIFKDLNPGFLNTMARNIEIFSDIRLIYESYIQDCKRDLCIISKNLVYIDYQKLLTYKAPKSILFEIISPYGFNNSQINKIYENGKIMQNGSYFSSESNRIIKYGNFFIIGPIKKIRPPIVITESEIQNTNLQEYTFEYISDTKEISFNNPNIAYVDASKIKFPLVIRNPIEGDFFRPFGMRGSKLISDFFTDLKLNTFEKEDALLLLSDSKIVWVIGYRIDDSFKIDPSTPKVLKIIKN